MKVTAKSRNILIIIAVLGVVGWKVFYDRQPKQAKESVAIGKITIADAPEASLSGPAAVKLEFPDTKVAVNGGQKGEALLMTWNAQFGLFFANGGPQTTVGSLFDKYKWQLTLTRQDDCSKSLTDMIKFCQDVKDKGVGIPGKFAVYMGDGMAASFSGTSKQLKELGDDYQLIGFDVLGKSDGEDKLLAPVDWKQNPRNAIGKTVSCYLRDGDMNILLKWAGDNDSLRVNPDETTFDPNAINLIAAADFIDAGNKYIAGYKESRKLIKNGKKTNETIEVGVDAVATWTPVDVNIAEKKGGLVTIASTKKYSTQMPALIITCKKWAEAHRVDIENMIAAIAQGSDQVRSFNDAKDYAGVVAAKVFGEKDGPYWANLYTGYTKKDAQGLSIDLGGSKAFNLNDAANMLGLGKDGLDRYQIVYTSFGDKISQLYPDLVPTYPDYKTVIDKSYITAVMNKYPELLEGKGLEVKYTDEIVSEVSSKSYAIQFEVGSDKIMPESYSYLNDIFKKAVEAEALTLGVYGHTDNTGSDDINIPLSLRRAEAVKKYLINKGLKDAQVITKGYGSTKPKDGVDANSVAGRKQNRRVEIVLGE